MVSGGISSAGISPANFNSFLLAVSLMLRLAVAYQKTAENNGRGSVKVDGAGNQFNVLLGGD